jgi:two-component system, OmpR family, sensor histidine kinase VicK
VPDPDLASKRWSAINPAGKINLRGKTDREQSNSSQNREHQYQVMNSAKNAGYFAAELEPPFASALSTHKIDIIKQSIITLKLWLQLTACIGLLPRTVIETTKVYYGEEDAMKILLQAMANVKKEAVVCSDANSPAFSMAMEPVKKLYIAFKETGVRIRQIVEITKDNLHYCKEFMDYVELRHIENVKGNMVVSETEFVATAVLEGSRPVTQTIYSNVKAFLEQQHYFFENLWSKAIPAGQRIKELEEETPPQRIETVYGQENTIQAILRFISKTVQEFCIYADSSGPSVAMSAEPVVQAYSDFKNTKNAKARWITEVNPSNIRYIVKLMQFAEVRHLDGIKGNAVAVNENECLTTINLKMGNSNPYAILNTVKEIVEQQKFTFETLWAKAVPAEHRIREIEQGVEPQRIEVIYDAGQALELYQLLIMSAEKEIKLMFPTTNALIRQDKAGILFLLQEAAKKCQVKVLMPNDELIHDFIPTNNSSSVSTRFIDQHESGKATILIIDNKVSLVMELKDDRKKTFHEAIGLSTYSNSKAGVLSYVTMFESLWKETQLYEELKSNEKIQKEFINTAAHELRTPVQPILGMAELIELSFEGGKGKTEISKDDIEIILRNAKRLERLASDVLETARIESKSLRLNKERFSLKEVISGSIRDAENQIDDRDITIWYNSKKDILVYADKGRISEVISNMLDNAIKFSHKGKITISAEVKHNNNTDEVIVLIRDEGTGIDSEIASRLFTKFATKSSKGTGLGLYISKSIVEAHSGKIWSKNNEDGKGATFGFSLPLHRD